MDEIKIKVRTSVLLEKIAKYKTRFVKSYEALLRAYAKKALKYQNNYAGFLEKVKQKSTAKQPAPPIRPIDRREKYDFYTKMIGEHYGEFVELSESLYRRLWQDKWDWISSHIYALEAYADSDADVAMALNLYQE